MVGASGGRGWEVLTAKGCPSFGDPVRHLCISGSRETTRRGSLG